MKKNIQDIFTYHEQTKHTPRRYARSLGYMDWANQPDPFRSYRGAKKITLPLAHNHSTPPYHLIFRSQVPRAPLVLESLSQFLQFSMGISAIKSNGIDEWALRCNASSGNLHPSEAYLLLPPLQGVSEQSSIAHYAPKDHSLEILSHFESSLFETLPKGSFFVLISSIVYREVWKYGERAFRYTQLDAGHAMRATQVSGLTLGWHSSLIDSLSDIELNKIFGLDQEGRFHPDERESADMLLFFSPQRSDTDIDLSSLTSTPLESIANTLASNHQKWPLISLIEEASSGTLAKREKAEPFIAQREPSRDAKSLILKRRSAQMMDKSHSWISKKSFLTLLHSTQESFSGSQNSVDLVLFVHSVEELDSGLYLYLRQEDHFEDLKSSLDPSFAFEKREPKLFLLKKGDYRAIAQNISCNQSIASDGAFSLGMLASFSQEIINYGEHRYKELYWECGAIGQQLYLESTSQGLSATGIGCFLDDIFHELLGLQSNKYQSLYHFTVGRALSDARILTKEPYAQRES